MQQSRETDAEIASRIGALRDGLKALGWTEGRDYQFEYRWPGLDPGVIRVAAAELVRMAPDVIVVGNTPSFAVTLRKETTTIPIVFVNLANPVGSGLVASFARPGTATSPVLPPPFEFTTAASGWRCSKRSRQVSSGRPSFSVGANSSPTGRNSIMRSSLPLPGSRWN